jgi:hypothetical protein
VSQAQVQTHLKHPQIPRSRAAAARLRGDLALHIAPGTHLHVATARDSRCERRSKVVEESQPPPPAPIFNRLGAANALETEPSATGSAAIQRHKVVETSLPQRRARISSPSASPQNASSSGSETPEIAEAGDSHREKTPESG